MNLTTEIRSEGQLEVYAQARRDSCKYLFCLKVSARRVLPVLVLPKRVQAEGMSEGLLNDSLPG